MAFRVFLAFCECARLFDVNEPIDIIATNDYNEVSLSVLKEADHGQSDNQKSG